MPITIRGRLLLQELWRLKLNWDDELPCDLLDKWNKLKSDLLLSTTLQLPRVITQGRVVDLHMFCDASNVAYGTVCYFTFSSEVFDENVKENVLKDTSRFVLARVKVTPIKHLTIPKLELTSVVLAS